MKPRQNITLVRQVRYGDSDFFGEAAWPLGSAIEAVTSEKINLKQFQLLEPAMNTTLDLELVIEGLL